MAVRLALIATTAGTFDALLKTIWADVVARYGIAGAYAPTPLLNHPPLSLAIMHVEDVVARWIGISYVDVFRFVQVLADCLTAFAVYRIGLRKDIDTARRLALFVLLSPAAAFISGFHCNTDPSMVALVATSVLFAIGEAPVLAGAALALAAGIKIVPLLLAPLFLIAFRGRRLVAFGVSFAIVGTAIFYPVLYRNPIALQRIFGYAGMDYEWGIPGIVLLLQGRGFTQADLAASGFAGYAAVARGAIAGLVALLLFLGLRARDREVLPAAVGAFFLGAIFLAPGFGVQYLAWPIAFLPFALGRRPAIAMNAAISLMLFLTYTIWNGGWPWWFADPLVQRPYRWVATAAAFALWPLVGIAAGAAIRRLIAGSRPRTESLSATADHQPSPGSD
ncbi:MAG: hypothetical protein JWO56_3175 [Acidobacteria bacterium]|nr:hypothetical protein [Acidobacteriota bacterium]